MGSPRVFIVQEPMTWNGEEMVSTMDMRPAAEYGQPIVCLTGGRSTMSPVPMVNRLREVLKDFCDDDFLLAAGDPSAIMVAGAVACDFNRGKVKILKWDKKMKMYIQVDINTRPSINKENYYDDRT